MSVWSRSRNTVRLPIVTLSLLVAVVMLIATACGDEDGPSATSTTAPAPAPQSAPTNTAAAATATTAAPAATATTAAPAATPTAGSSGADYGDDYGDDYGEDEATKAPADDPAGSDDVTIPIQGFRFQPAEITVTVGTTITWTNMDNAPHSATADDDSFNTGVLGENESGSVTFDTAGTFTYYCLLHPNMTATVIVTN
ncbi:MAG TPA: plastocyanin/azurin family copper-binding protein [Thermomicrobiales bacterium]|nr:plastocyanin/azurin family copper-binding protein [Thermomicrobiales bacterium]